MVLLFHRTETTELPGKIQQMACSRRRLTVRDFIIYVVMVNPLVLWLIICLVSASLYGLLPRIHLFDSMVSPVSLRSIFLLWAVWQAWCMLVNRQKLYSANAITKLARSGPYALVRHPVYMANIVLLTACALYYPELWFMVSAGFAAAMLVVWAKLEERILLKCFGAEYRDYMGSVPAMNPFPVLLRRIAAIFRPTDT